MAKKKVSETDDLADLSYEEALGKLETIVEEMESGDMELEKLINHYEEGMRLRKVCSDKLEQAEVKIKALEESMDGKFSVKPLTVAEESE